MRIALGCGKREKTGFVGLDIVDFGWNKIWDATKDDLPFDGGVAEFIEMENFLEHIERKHWIRLMNECNRVLKPNGILEITVPDAAKSMDVAMGDITHVSLFTRATIPYLTGGRPRNADYGLKSWHIVSIDDHPKDPRVLLIRLQPNK